AASDRKARLHALWVLIGSVELDPAFHIKMLAQSDPAFRAWGVRAAGNFGEVTPAIRETIDKLASDPSPDVQLQVVIASRKIKNFDALPVLAEVLAGCGQDKLIPSIAWNNLHPLLETDSGRFVKLVSEKQEWSPAVASLSARVVDRMLSAGKPEAGAVAAFLRFVTERDQERAKECLSAISSKLKGLGESTTRELKAALKPELDALLADDSGTPLFLSAQLLAAELELIKV